MSVLSLPRQTSAWYSGEALRRAVNVQRSTFNIHPSERWLAWTRSWVSNPPPSGEGDRFTAVPTRRNDAHPTGAEVRSASSISPEGGGNATPAMRYVWRRISSPNGFSARDLVLPDNCVWSYTSVVRRLRWRILRARREWLLLIGIRVSRDAPS